MTVAKGIQDIGPSNGKVIVNIYKDGIAKGMGHDLAIGASSWSGKADINPDDPSSSSVEATIAPVASPVTLATIAEAGNPTDGLALVWDGRALKDPAAASQDAEAGTKRAEAVTAVTEAWEQLTGKAKGYEQYSALAQSAQADKAKLTRKFVNLSPCGTPAPSVASLRSRSADVRPVPSVGRTRQRRFRRPVRHVS